MNKTPDEIRREIELTRGELGTDVDAVQEKVSPSSIAHRKTERARGKFHHLKSSIMGHADEAGSKAHQVEGMAEDRAHQASEALHDAPHQVEQQTKGNPMAAGLIAFGVGMVASALIPPSQKEKEAAQRIKEKAEPLVSEAKNTAKEVAEDMKEPARQAAEEVKSSAQESADTVKEEGRGAAEDVKGRAEEGQRNVKGSSGSSGM